MMEPKTRVMKVATFSLQDLKGSGKVRWPLPQYSVPTMLEAMKLQPPHRILTIAAYGRGLAMIPFVSGVVAIDRDEGQLGYNALIRAFAMADGPLKFLELLGLVLSKPRERNEISMDDQEIWEHALELIAMHVPKRHAGWARTIFCTGGLDAWKEHHRVDGVERRVVMDRIHVGERLFPHVISMERYRDTRAKIEAGAYEIMHIALPDDMAFLDGHRFDRIFLDNAMTFIYHEKGIGREWIAGFIEKLRGLLRDKDSFIIDLEHSSRKLYNGELFYMGHVNAGNACILDQFNDGNWRYTIFQ